MQEKNKKKSIKQTSFHLTQLSETESFSLSYTYSSSMMKNPSDKMQENQWRRRKVKSFFTVSGGDEDRERTEVK